MTANNTTYTTYTTYSTPFLLALEAFALAYRWHGPHGYDRRGAGQQLRASWRAEFGEDLIGPDPALKLCREFVAVGKRAFEV